MREPNPQGPFILAILFGIIILIIPSSMPFPILHFLAGLLGGGLLGYFWPKESWRWGIWITGPMSASLSLSVLFAGQVEVFFNKDLPILLATFISTCLGSFLTARLKKR
jgi:hypothetical protein